MAEHAGRITNIGEPYGSNKNHVRVEVTHGKRKRSKGPDGEKGELMDHSRPSSTVVIPKAHAKDLKYGDRVKVHLTKDDAAPGEDEEETDADVDNGAPVASAPAKAPPKSPPKGGKRKNAAKAGPKHGPIFKAMTAGR